MKSNVKERVDLTNELTISEEESLRFIFQKLDVKEKGLVDIKIYVKVRSKSINRIEIIDIIIIAIMIILIIRDLIMILFMKTSVIMKLVIMTKTINLMMIFFHTPETFTFIVSLCYFVHLG